MTIPIQDRNRLEMRQAIGRNLSIVTIGAATTTTDTSSIIDTVNLRGGDDEHIGKQVMIFDPAGSIVAGEISLVSDYAGSTHDATVAPVFSSAVTTGDDFEMWEFPWFKEDIDDAINQAIMEATKWYLVEKQTSSAFTITDRYEYDCLSSFNALWMVEYVSSIETFHEIDDCDSAWTAGTNGTVTADTTYKQQGTACNKVVVAAGASTNETVAYNTFSSLDISDCDELEVSIRSSVALTAGQYQILLDDTAAGGSALESLDIPATSANTWTRHKISLANPVSDTALVRVDLYQVADVGACTIYIDYIIAVDSKSRIYKELNPGYWSIVRGSTDYLKLTPTALGITGTNTLLRISGYQEPSLLSDDTTDSTVDPAWIINHCTADLLMGHSKSRYIDIDNKENRAKYFAGKALASKPTTNIHPDTRVI